MESDLSDNTEDLRKRLRRLLDEETREEGSLAKVSSMQELEERLDQMLVTDTSHFTEEDSEISEQIEPIQEEVVVSGPTDKRIMANISIISDTFSFIFQALLQLSSEQERQSNRIEVDRSNKRSREFNIRLSKAAFELKQKVNLRQVFL